MASLQTPPCSDDIEYNYYYKVHSYNIVQQTHPDLPCQTPNNTTTTVVTIIFQSSIKILKWSHPDTISNMITIPPLSENWISKYNINLFTDESTAMQTIDAALSLSTQEVNCLPCPLKDELTHSIVSDIQSTIQEFNCTDLAEIVFMFDVVVMEHILRCHDGGDISERSSLEKINEDCVICFDEIVTETESYFPCGHCFHAYCILIWLLEKDTCPICRYNLSA